MVNVARKSKQVTAVPFSLISLPLQNNKTGLDPFQDRFCCIYQPAFGWCTPNMLVEIFIFSVFCAQKLKNAKSNLFDYAVDSPSPCFLLNFAANLLPFLNFPAF